MSVLINLSALLDYAKCFELVRQTRWPRGVRCPKCGGEHVARNGHDDTQPHRQRYPLSKRTVPKDPTRKNGPSAEVATGRFCWMSGDQAAIVEA
jgi:hypothetical protein